MNTRQAAFGHNLRRARLRRGVSLEMIAAVTKVPVPLWEAFEENELSLWPSGVLARTFVSEYARLIGEDPAEAVNEFCRLFPQGDRRRSRTVEAMATLLGQPTVWTDGWPPSRERRTERRRALERLEDERDRNRRLRLAMAGVDVTVVGTAAGALALVVHTSLAAAVTATAIVYFGGSALARVSPGEWLVRRWTGRRDRSTRARWTHALGRLFAER